MYPSDVMIGEQYYLRDSIRQFLTGLLYVQNVFDILYTKHLMIWLKMLTERF